MNAVVAALLVLVAGDPFTLALALALAAGAVLLVAAVLMVCEPGRPARLVRGVVPVSARVLRHRATRRRRPPARPGIRVTAVGVARVNGAAPLATERADPLSGPVPCDITVVDPRLCGRVPVFDDAAWRHVDELVGC